MSETVHLAKDRSGEICPFCKKGKLSPIGHVFEEQHEGIKEGEFGRAERRYKCDYCGKVTKSFGIGLNDSL